MIFLSGSLAGIPAFAPTPDNGNPSNGVPDNGNPSNGVPDNGNPSNGVPDNELRHIDKKLTDTLHDYNAIPNLIESRKGSNETVAIGALKTLVSLDDLDSGIYYFFKHTSTPHQLVGQLDNNAIASLKDIISKSNDIISTSSTILQLLPPCTDNQPPCPVVDVIKAEINSINTEANTINARALTFIAGTIIVEKDTVGGDGTFNFITNSTAYPSFSITTVNGVGTMTLNNMPINTGFVIKEVGGSSNFAFASVSCSNVQGSNIFFPFPASEAATVQLVSGTNVVKCTFTNTASGTGSGAGGL